MAELTRRNGQLALILPAVLAGALLAAGPGWDFSGRWELDTGNSKASDLPFPPAAAMTIQQQDVTVRFTVADGTNTTRTYLLDGTETRSSKDGDTWSCVAKWEGAALLVKTEVSGGHSYHVADRWQLSSDGTTLIIDRKVVSGGAVVAGQLVYKRVAVMETDETTPVALPGSESTAPPQTPPAPPATAPPLAESLAAAWDDAAVQPPQRRTDTDPSADYLIPAGTRIPLILSNQVDTRRTRAGDHVYLEVSVPVFAAGRQVIPKGSYVNGVVAVSKPATGVKGKGQLLVYFEKLILLNGIERDFHSRMGSADIGRGLVDKEGGVTGQRDSSKDLQDAVMGAELGAMAGGVTGSRAGMGMGAAAGAVGGLMMARLSNKANVLLPRGAVIEMVLDRDLTFTREELTRW